VEKIGGCALSSDDTWMLSQRICMKEIQICRGVSQENFRERGREGGEGLTIFALSLWSHHLNVPSPVKEMSFSSFSFQDQWMLTDVFVERGGSTLLSTWPQQRSKRTGDGIRSWRRRVKGMGTDRE
jgi:hypothetical protein